MNDFNLPALERRVQAQWKHDGTFAAAQDPGRPLRAVLEGPPTMNGSPGVHHVEARAFKDLYARLWTMQGYHVPRRAGWDCHGLPVELSVAQRLGLKGRQEVLDHGLDAFSQACASDVEAHQARFAELTERMGYWVDLERPWRTMDPESMDTAWSVLSQLWDKGLLTHAKRATPWCPSCSTGLSSHEVSQGAGRGTDETLVVRLQLLDSNDELLVWTTTAWTLGENLLVGVDAKARYARVRTGEGVVVVAAEQAPQWGEVLEELSGASLVGARYQPPLGTRRSDAHAVVDAPFVVAAAGTGLVHVAPAYGADDLEQAVLRGLDFDVDLGPDGVFQKGPFSALRFDEVSSDVVARAGVRVHAVSSVEHEVFRCWRCSARLVNLARPSWFLAVTRVRGRMLSYVDQTQWHPEPERYRSWVSTSVDWALSRERFWGTPLPVWTCGEDHVTLVHSRADLAARCGVDLAGVDLHRPRVDELTFPCHCGLDSRRVPEVLDAWFDSALAPLLNGVETADLLAEGVDQTRGWFYTLSAVAALLDRPSPFKEVLSLGLVLDESGKKMSKSRGNVLDPFELFEEFGADAVRWSLLCDGSAHDPRRFSRSSLHAARSLMAKAWAVAEVLEQPLVVEPDTDPLARWLWARVQECTQDVTDALDERRSDRAGAALATLVEDLSSRFLRARRAQLDARTRETLRSAVERLALLMAPVAPHFADALFEKAGGVGSVHLQPWPTSEEPDDEALGAGAELWSLVEEGFALRTRAGLRLRQPLASATLRGGHLPQNLRSTLAALLNVKSLHVEPAATELRPNWRGLGRRFGSRAPQVAALLPATGGNDLTVELGAETFALCSGDDYVLRAADRLQLDTELTAALKEEGHLADLLRAVVDARRSAGLTPGQPCAVDSADPSARALLARHPQELASRHCFLGPGGVRV